MSSIQGDMPKSCVHHLRRRRFKTGFQSKQKFHVESKTASLKDLYPRHEHNGFWYLLYSTEKLKKHMLGILMSLGHKEHIRGVLRLTESASCSKSTNIMPGALAQTLMALFPQVYVARCLTQFSQELSVTDDVTTQSHIQESHSFRGQKVKINIYSTGMCCYLSPACVRSFVKLC